MEVHEPSLEEAIVEQPAGIAGEVSISDRIGGVTDEFKAKLTLFTLFAFWN
jgi:hypothetical protein